MKRVAQQALQISCTVRSVSSSLHLQKCALFLTAWRAWNSRCIFHIATFSALESTRPLTVLSHKVPKALWCDNINHASFYVTRSSFSWVRNTAQMVGLRSLLIWNFTTETRTKKTCGKFAGRCYDSMTNLQTWRVRFVGYRLTMRTANWLQCNSNEPSFSLRDGLCLDQLTVNFPKTFLVRFSLVLEQGKDKNGHMHVVKTHGRVEG